MNDRPALDPADLPAMALGFRIAQALAAVARLRVADALAGGPRSAADIAADVGAHPDRLRRTLRALAADGVFTEDEAGLFGLTPFSERLAGDTLERLMILGWWMLPASYAAFGRLPDAVRSGETAFELANGRGFYEHLAATPGDEAAYEAANAATTDAFDQLCGLLDLDATRHVVDIGGGNGAFLTAALRGHPHLRGTLLDRPSVVAGVADRLDAGVRDRLTVCGADMFEHVPGGGDLYVTCTVLRCFDDDDCVRLLGRIASAMPAGARFAACEQLVPPGPAQRPWAALDLTTMVVYGGRDRTEAEFAAVFERAGLRLTRVLPAQPPFAVMEAR